MRFAELYNMLMENYDNIEDMDIDFTTDAVELRNGSPI